VDKDDDKNYVEIFEKEISLLIVRKDYRSKRDK